MSESLSADRRSIPIATHAMIGRLLQMQKRILQIPSAAWKSMYMMLIVTRVEKV